MSDFFRGSVHRHKVDILVTVCHHFFWDLQLRLRGSIRIISIGLVLGRVDVSISITNPRHPVIFSADDWGVQSPSQQCLLVPLPFSEGDRIPRETEIEVQNKWRKTAQGNFRKRSNKPSHPQDDNVHLKREIHVSIYI